MVKDREGGVHPSQDAAELKDARRLLAEFVEHYNRVRLHTGIGYVVPAKKLAGREEVIWAERKRKLAEAEARRRAAGVPATAAPGP